MLLDQKTARELETSLGRYAQWMGQLRRYARARYGIVLRGEGPGCVMQQDLALLYQQELSRSAQRTADWCWAVDAVCRQIGTGGGRKDADRFSGLLRLYYGLGLDAAAQEEYMSKPAPERRHAVMRELHMEQTTFYATRSVFLSALYMACVQRGLYRPFPDIVLKTVGRQGRDLAEKGA